jgi:hypothetical protein
MLIQPGPHPWSHHAEGRSLLRQGIQELVDLRVLGQGRAFTI